MDYETQVSVPELKGYRITQLSDEACREAGRGQEMPRH